MADSVDRVFGHALNTVNKIRTGSQKPPVSERLKLYGLYKQAMEGDVGYVQARPAADSKEQDKWDAWAANAGLSRTAAKKQYIETLISTMHEYASATPEARELVAELEFVWDQIRNNSNPSDSSPSSPLQLHEQAHAAYPGLASSNAAGFGDGAGLGGGDGARQPMRVLSPVSQGAEEDKDDMDDEREEFVDAPVSQFGDQYHEQEEDGQEESAVRDAYDGAGDDRPPDNRPRRPSTREMNWRRRVEGAIVKMTAEVAALREQLESRSYIAQRRRHSLWGWILRLSWFLVKAVVADVFILWIVILWLRRKKDRRLEGAIRVLLGDAVAQMQKVGSNMKVPKLSPRKT
ncbi:hypothetical protein MBLNU459_g3869t1 [Dothideomycetes sp. NU459]